MATKKASSGKGAPKAELRISGSVEITADEVAGLPLGYGRKGDVVTLHPDVAKRLVKDGQAKHV